LTVEELQVKISAEIEELKKGCNGAKQELREVSNTADSMQKSIKNAFDVIKGSAIIATIHKVSSECINAYTTQFNAEQKLTTAMRANLNATDAQINSIKKLASAQQDLGVVGDEVQLAGIAQLSMYKMEISSIEKLVPAMNDLIVAKDGLNASVGTATDMGKKFAETLSGQADSLKEVGIYFTEAEKKILQYGSEADKVNLIVQKVSNTVGGMNAAMGDTPLGKLQQMKNTWGDIKELVGEICALLLEQFGPTIVYILDSLKETLEAMITIWDMFTLDSKEFYDKYIRDDLFPDSSKNADNLADSISGLTDEIIETGEEAKKTLAIISGFDELNIINRDSLKNDTSGGGKTNGSGAGRKNNNNTKPTATQPTTSSDNEKQYDRTLLNPDKILKQFKDLKKQIEDTKIILNVSLDKDKVIEEAQKLIDELNKLFDEYGLFECHINLIYPKSDEINQITDSLISTKDAAISLDNSIQELANNIDNLNNTTLDAKTVIDNFIQSIENLIESINRLIKAINDLCDAIQALYAKVLLLIDAFNDLDSIIRDTYNDLNLLTKLVDEFGKYSSRFVNNVSDMSKSLDNLRDSAESAYKEIEQLKKSTPTSNDSTFMSGSGREHGGGGGKFPDYNNATNDNDYNTGGGGSTRGGGAGRRSKYDYNISMPTKTDIPKANTTTNNSYTTNYNNSKTSNVSQVFNNTSKDNTKDIVDAIDKLGRDIDESNKNNRTVIGDEDIARSANRGNNRMKNRAASYADSLTY